MTFISRILGFVRDLVLAHTFGAGAHMDAFVIAFKIPNFFRRLFAEGAFSQAFIPLLAEVKDEDSATFTGKALGNLSMVLMLLTAAGLAFAPQVITIFAPGFVDEPERFETAVSLLSLTFGYVWLISLTALLSGILNTYRYFALPALTPVLLNVALITAAMSASFFDPPIMALGVGVLAGGFLQLGAVWLGVCRAKLRPKISFDWRDKKIKRLLTLMLPAMLGASVAQINLLLDTWFASLLPSGSVSYLYYADRLLEFPLGVFGVALATVMLPNLSAASAAHDQSEYQSMLAWALRIVIVIALPAAFGLFFLADNLISTLFQYGAYTAEDASASARALAAYSLGLPSMVLVKVLVSGYFARQDTKTPMRIAIVALVANTVLNLVLMGPLGHVGLALATTLSSTINALLLAFTIRAPIFASQFKLFTKVMAACAVMTLVLKVSGGPAKEWLGSVGQLITVIGLGMGAYAATLLLLKVKPHHLRF